MRTGTHAHDGRGSATQPTPERERPFYEMRHVVSFEETNVVGNVYFTSHVKWMGRCRELFLRSHAPEVVDELANGLALVTRRVDCDYLGELVAFSEVIVRMRLVDMAGNRMLLAFEILASEPEGLRTVATGHQEILSMRRSEGRLEPTPIPFGLREALTDYTATTE